MWMVWVGCYICGWDGMTSVVICLSWDGVWMGWYVCGWDGTYVVASLKVKLFTGPIHLSRLCLKHYLGLGSLFNK